jgi:hypothetical protein
MIKETQNYCKFTVKPSHVTMRLACGITVTSDSNNLTMHSPTMKFAYYFGGVGGVVLPLDECRLRFYSNEVNTPMELWILDTVEGSVSAKISQKLNEWETFITENIAKIGNYKLPDLPLKKDLDLVHKKLVDLEEDFYYPLGMLEVNDADELVRLKEKEKELVLLIEKWEPWVTILEVVGYQKEKIEKLYQFYEQHGWDNVDPVAAVVDVVDSF